MSERERIDMADSGGGRPSERESERIPLDAAVDLEFESFQGFLSEYSSNLSLGGMFVRMSSPPPVGTKLRFSLRLKGSFNLVKGRGEVMWVREESGGEDRPTGAGIRFLEIDEPSRDLIARMVDRHLGQGGRPFELAPTGPPPQAPPPATHVPVVDQPRGSEEGAGGSASRAGKIAAAQPGEGLMEDIFVPPEMSPAAVSRAARSGTGAALPPQRRTAVRSRRVRPSLVLTALVAALLGALVFHFGKDLLPMVLGVDEALADRVVYDLPPPATLKSEAARRKAEVDASAGIPAPLAVGDDGASAAKREPAAAVAEPPAPPGPIQEQVDGTLIATTATGGEELSQVRLITWKADPARGATVITLWGNGSLPREHLQWLRLGGRQARQLLKLQGINWPFRDPILDVESPEVRRIRTGFHPKPDLNELHVVIDLMEPDVQLSRIELGERSIQLHFTR